MFITKKKINGKEYFYLRESRRINGKVRAITVSYLGKSRAVALIKAQKFFDSVKGNTFKETLSITKMADDKKLDEPPQASDIAQSISSVDDLATFCKRRGFVYPSSEIYGGIAGIWDYGPVGVELKNNIKKEWWNFHVRKREDMVGIDGAIITPRKVWEASGHVSTFFDVAVKCKRCKNATKIDASAVGKEKCEKCGGDYEILGKFNQLFPVNIGALNPVEAYLRGETAQLIFTNFRLVQENARLSLPFGIAQIGKAFRNEISPREFIFRCREFEQMEIEYFIAPNQSCPYNLGDTEVLVYSSDMQLNEKSPEFMNISEALKKGIIRRDWHAYWIEQEILWFKSLGIDNKKFRVRQHKPEEKSHYSSDTWDLEYKFPMGWRELQGFADRSTYDLIQHQKFSGKKMEITDAKFGKVLPEVVCEPSIGVERTFMLLMLEAYHYDKSRENVVLKLHPKISPIKAAVFPIVKVDEAVVKIARDIYESLREEFSVIYDDSGSVGRRYSRNDEIGTPFCITADEGSVKNHDVTIRDRDTTKQIRVKISCLKDVLRMLINRDIDFLRAGKLVSTRVK